MLRKTTLTASLLAVAALAPAAAHAAGDHGLRLGGQPTMHAIDAHVRFAGAQRISGLKAVGTHGDDIRYQATVTSTPVLRIGAKYTVRIKLAESATVTRLVKLHAPSGY